MSIQEQVDHFRAAYILQRDKILTPERKKKITRAGRIARNGVIFTASLVATGVGAAVDVVAYDAISHAKGKDGLTNGYLWGEVHPGNCVGVAFIATHPVQPAEDVIMHVQSFVKEDVQPGYEFSLSRKPIVVGGQAFCFEEPLSHAGVILWAENGDIQGAKEIFEFSSP